MPTMGALSSASKCSDTGSAVTQDSSGKATFPTITACRQALRARAHTCGWCPLTAVMGLPLMTIERDDQGQLVCRQCGQLWIVPDEIAILLEQLVAHALTHVPAELADETKPQIWLR